MHFPEIFCYMIKAGVAPTSHFYFHHLSFSYLHQFLFWFLYAFFQSCCICSMLHLLPLCLLFFLPEDFTVSCSLFPAAFYQSTFFIVSTCFVRFYLLRFMFFSSAKKRFICSLSIMWFWYGWCIEKTPMASSKSS